MLGLEAAADFSAFSPAVTSSVTRSAGKTAEANSGDAVIGEQRRRKSRRGGERKRRGREKKRKKDDRL